MSDLVPVGFPTIPTLTDPDFVGALQRDIDDLRRALATAIGTGGVSSGDVKMSASATAPDGWLICDGSAVSRTTYAALFGRISTAYGVGDGSTTFNLPDLRGRVPVGLSFKRADESAWTPPSVVNALGDSDGFTAAADMPKRRPQHQHTNTVEIGQMNVGVTGTFNANDRPASAQTPARVSGAAFSFGIAGDTGGPVDAPAYQVVNFLIKT